MANNPGAGSAPPFGVLQLPSVLADSENASKTGQDHYTRWSAIRLGSLFAAAVAAAIQTGGTTSGSILGYAVLVAFIVAAIAEIILISSQPERDWYAGRALAESTKTLAWRYSVQGEPFGGGLAEAEAERLLRTRLQEVIDKGSDRVTISLGSAVVTDSMKELRNATFEVRRNAYIMQRTDDQRRWYAAAARKNAIRARWFRWGLLAAEVLAVAVAAIFVTRSLPIDYAGVIAAGAASAAAWLALKQRSPLASAYRVAAAELALQDAVLRSATASEWSRAVADAEEAISREHTMWLASRGEKPARNLFGGN